MDRLDGLLYGARGDQMLEDDGRTVVECERDWEKYGIFNFLTNWGEQFDRAGKSFIFCPPAEPVKVLIRPRDTDGVLSLHASMPAVTEAIHMFLRWFEDSAALLSNQIST
ncbi:hypothetical protein [Paraburkholderia caffeinilytica]|uniref:Uncharacterized protein n=1 Tax=Paraburkholderia caffeinilytica TaxID=1761016 RepID=A0ABQ1MYP3_9BURK|nr:hypothetical protein [Paraburkholderia caffeinilytica]GGC48814.1 hypothetical protein GCM10011400_40230 [Paraburkholderia caffeinilytica]